MSLELLAILVTGAVQLAGLAFLGSLVYRQGLRVSPGEAAILLEARKHRAEILEAVRQALATSP
jgi:cobalamin biosynthesis protein CbiD